LFKFKDVENKYLCDRMVLMHMHLREKKMRMKELQQSLLRVDLFKIIREMACWIQNMYELGIYNLFNHSPSKASSWT
jgi:hypothetical protein